MNFKEAAALVRKLLEADLDNPNTFLRYYVSPFERFSRALRRIGFALAETDDGLIQWTWKRGGRYEIEITKSDHDPNAISWDADEDQNGYDIWAYVYSDSETESSDGDPYDHAFVKTEQEALERATRLKRELLNLSRS